MIVVRLKGGMGNQMFQYAFGLKMASLLSCELKLDLSDLLDRSKGDQFVYRNYDLDIFELSTAFVHGERMLANLARFKSSSITKFFRNRARNGLDLRKEKDFEFQDEFIINPLDNCVYEGWFQSFRYLEGIEDEVLRSFIFTSDILAESRQLLDRILDAEAICLNVRRTDFITTDNLNVTDLNYFKRGIEYMIKHVDNPNFFIFSDDVEWCRENFTMDHPMEIVDHEHKGRKFGNYLQLMTKCKHFIIPNSSFAWWAVRLSTSPNKQVVAPKKWFNDVSIETKDLIPANWIRL